MAKTHKRPSLSLWTKSRAWAFYEYRDKKEDEIKKLNFNHEDFKVEIENNQKKYEQLIDEAADQISNFVKKAKIDNLSQ